MLLYIRSRGLYTLHRLHDLAVFLVYLGGLDTDPENECEGAELTGSLELTMAD